MRLFWFTYAWVAWVSVLIAGAIVCVAIRRRQLKSGANKGGNIGDWRIQLIPHKGFNRGWDSRLNEKSESVDGIPRFLGRLGLVMFLAGLCWTLSNRGNSIRMVSGLAFAFAGCGGCLYGAWLKARNYRQGWMIAEGRCLDREIRRIMSSDGNHIGWIWSCRIICEYEYCGVMHRVTPSLTRAAFSSEQAVTRYLDVRIAGSGQCRIHFNPKNPLETFLYGDGICDTLHS